MDDDRGPQGRLIPPEEWLGMERIPPALSVQEAAHLLRVSKQSVYRAAEDGELRSLKVRGRLVIASRPLLETLGWPPSEPPRNENAPA